MKIDYISVRNEGYAFCRSRFYYSEDILCGNLPYNFSVGVNKLIGEIDSGNWAISYLLSMYKHRPKDFVLFEQPSVTVNDEVLTLDKLSAFSCYMDTLDPLFFTKDSVKGLIEQGLMHSKLNYTYEDIKKIFCLDDERVGRPLASVGNEVFRAMAAIGFSHDKEIFCFPWLSSRRFENYHQNLTSVLQILAELEKVVIIPVGRTTG